MATREASASESCRKYSCWAVVLRCNSKPITAGGKRVKRQLDRMASSSPESGFAAAPQTQLGLQGSSSILCSRSEFCKDCRSSTWFLPFVPLPQQALTWERSGSVARTTMPALRFGKSHTAGSHYRMAFSITGNWSTFHGTRRSERTPLEAPYCSAGQRSVLLVLFMCESY